MLASGFDRRLSGAERGGGLVDVFLARPFPQQRQILPGLLGPRQSDVLALLHLIELILRCQLFGNQVGDPLEFDAGVIEIGLRLGQLRLCHAQFLNAGSGLQSCQHRLRRFRLSGGVAQCQLVIASIQLGDQLFGLDGVTLVYQQFGDTPTDLKSQIHLPRLHRTGQLDSFGINRALPRPAKGHQYG